MQRIGIFVSENLFEVVSYVFNALLVLIALIALWSLWGISADAWSAGGGMPPLDRSTLDAALADPRTLLRFGNLAIAWGAGVFAVGCLFLVFAGMRHLVYAGARLVVRMDDGIERNEA